MWTRLCLQWLCLAVLVAGCSARSATIGLQGDVTYDGVPIGNGKIEFIPVDNTPGAPAGAAILNGRYVLPQIRGVLLNGVYQIRITAGRKTGKRIQNYIVPTDRPIELEENFIPAMYNVQSTLQVRVAEIIDATKADFHIGKDGRH